MSIVKIKDTQYLRVDWTLGASKNNAIKFYSDLIDYLKETIQNSPLVVIIVEYSKHIPLFQYYSLPKTLNGNTFRNMFLNCSGIARADQIGNKTGIMSGCFIDINDIEFIKYFLKIISNVNNFTDIDEEVTQNILHLFSKFAENITFIINATYHINSIYIRSIPEFKNHKYYYTIAVTFNPKFSDINNKFVVNIQKINDIYSNVYTSLQTNIITEDYINNMYYMVNFSHNREYLGKGVEFIHPWFRKIIKDNFPEFYNAVVNVKRVKIYANKLNIIYTTVARVCEESKELYTDIPDELNNVFLFVSRLMFKISIKILESGTFVTTLVIALRKN
jgi:hypothetical protein